MVLGIMQPYFFPYLGYFSLIKHTDKWIVLDTVQYIRHGWINRNRVLNPSGGLQYITIPLKKHNQHTLIKDILISDGFGWKDKILRQLQHYKKYAPFYHEVMTFLEECFSYDETSITNINVHFLTKVCQKLKINLDLEVFSKMNLSIANIFEPGDWALEIAKRIGANTYINPPGGKDIFNRKKFKASGIELGFLQINLKEYSQGKHGFEPGLSIIDVMMFNPPDKIAEMLDDMKIEK